MFVLVFIPRGGLMYMAYAEWSAVNSNVVDIVLIKYHINVPPPAVLKSLCFFIMVAPDKLMISAIVNSI